MATSKNKLNYIRRYEQENIRQIKFNFSKLYDQDIIAALDAQPNKQGYIKSLIRADIARANSKNTKEDKYMEFGNAPLDPRNDSIDFDTFDQSAQDETNPGIPAGVSGLWYAVQRDRDDNWSNGSSDRNEAIKMARKLRENYPDTLISVIDTDMDYPFCTEEINDF